MVKRNQLLPLGVRQWSSKGTVRERENGISVKEVHAVAMKAYLDSRN